MFPLIVLVLTTIGARQFGILFDVEYLFAWPNALAVGLSVMLLFTASAHFFQPRRNALIEMVPWALGRPRVWVTFTGVLEILGAIGLHVPVTRTVAAICLALLFVAMFPANTRAAQNNTGLSSMKLSLRVLVQMVFVVACLIVA